MSEENKAILRRFIEEVLNKKNLGAADQFMAPNFVDHDPASPGAEPNIEGFKQAFGVFFTAFPDLTYTIEDIMAEGDKVVVRGTFRGTQRAEFMGIPATGKEINVTGIHIARMANGKMVEHWGNDNDLGMMQQLGVIPEQG